MFKIILAFLIAFAICFFGIKGFRDLTGRDKWALTKLIGYSILCSLLSIAILIFIVLIF